MANHFSIFVNTVNKMKRPKDLILEDEPPRLVVVQYATGEEQKQIRKNEEPELTQQHHSVVDVSGGQNKVRSYKEQYCIGTWNVKSVNQDELDAVKQAIARLTTNILGISELKWAVRGEYNSGDHYIYCCEQESLRRNGVALIVNKRVRNAVLGYNLKK